MRRSFILSGVALAVLSVLNFCLWRLLEAERMASALEKQRQVQARRAAGHGAHGFAIVTLDNGQVYVEDLDSRPADDHEFNPPPRAD